MFAGGVKFYTSVVFFKNGTVRFLTNERLTAFRC